MVTTKVKNLNYQCPYCGKMTNYETDSLPTPQCHDCLKEFDGWDLQIYSPWTNGFEKEVIEFYNKYYGIKENKTKKKR